MQLEGRKIVLGITGGIAAYKTCEICRLLKKQGADVHVVMTEAACKLVSKTTLETLSCHKVLVDIFDKYDDEVSHIALTYDADLMLIAPATANSIAKLACGLADNTLTASVLAAACPIVVAPAMNSRMYSNMATQENITTLKRRGFIILAPNKGELACGEIGDGRMREPQEIVSFICSFLNKEGIPYNENSYLPSPQKPLEIAQTKLLPKSHGAGFKVLITAGPTQEPIDPVRYISNKSSGKMGYALAQAAYERGAFVTIISGPVEQKAIDGISLIKVKTAEQMYDAVMKRACDYDIVIGCAAVADYHVENVADDKLTKEQCGESMSLKLVKNKDIISAVGHIENKRPFTVGFAAETSHDLEHAKEKIVRKNLDLIVLNNVASDDVGFNSDFNACHILDRQGEIANLQKATKQVIAGQILDIIFDIKRKS